MSFIALSHVLLNSFSLVYHTEFDVFAKLLTRVAVVGNKYLIRSYFNLRTNTQIHTPTVVQGVGGCGRNPSPEFLICCSISKRFAFSGKPLIFSTR